MSAYTIAQLEALATGQGRARSDTYRYQNSLNTSQLPPLTPVGIRERIYRTVKDANGAAVPRSEIARRLGLKKSPWLNQSIEGLVRDGYLVKTEVTYRTGAPMFVYELRC